MAANFFYISTCQETQSKLATEIRSTFDSVEKIKLGSKLDSCIYLKAVVEETLRMSPSVPGVLPRRVMAGGIEVVGHKFPAGVELAVPIYAIHHNPKYYPDPHRHNPDRWLANIVGEENVAKSRSAFHPFSYGSRQCIGMKLAYMELWITLARAIFLYDFRYIEGGFEDSFDTHPVEYKLVDHMAAARSGPIIQFVKRV